MVNIKHVFWIVQLTALFIVMIMSILFVGKESEKLDNIKDGESN